MGNTNLPDETVIKFSKKKVLALLLAICTLWADYAFWKMTHGFWSCLRAVVILLIGLFLLYISVKELLLIRKTQLVIGAKGIIDNQGNFYAWTDIDQERIVRSGEHTHALVFIVNGSFNITIDVSELTKDADELALLLKDYRQMAGISS